MYDGVLVEVDRQAAQVLQILEEAMETPVSATDICTETGQSKTGLTGLVRVINNLCCSVMLLAEERADDTYYTAEFRVLDNAHVPYGKTFTEKEIVEVEVPVEKVVEKVVEKEIVVEKVVPVEIGSKVQPTKLTRAKKNTTNKKKLIKNDKDFIWPDTPEIPEMPEGFLEPSYYDELEIMLEHGQHIAIFGQPGIGKSTSAIAKAAEHGVSLVTFSASAGLRKFDLEGTPEIVEGRSATMVAEYAAAVVHGWWVLIEEINTAHPDIVPYMMGQLAPPYKVQIKGRGFQAHPDFRMIITYNPGLAGTKIMNSAFLDRFYPVPAPVLDENTFKKILVQHGADTEELVDRLWLFTNSVWSSKDTSYQLSPRRVFQAILLITKKDMDVYGALRKTILPQIQTATEVAEVKMLIDAAKRFYDSGHAPIIDNSNMEVKS